MLYVYLSATPFLSPIAVLSSYYDVRLMRSTMRAINSNARVSDLCGVRRGRVAVSPRLPVVAPVCTDLPVLMLPAQDYSYRSLPPGSRR